LRAVPRPPRRAVTAVPSLARSGPSPPSRGHSVGAPPPLRRARHHRSGTRRQVTGTGPGRSPRGVCDAPREDQLHAEADIPGAQPRS
jgi:hypothetical protein